MSLWVLKAILFAQLHIEPVWNGNPNSYKALFWMGGLAMVEGWSVSWKAQRSIPTTIKTERESYFEMFSAELVTVGFFLIYVLHLIQNNQVFVLLIFKQFR